MLGIGIARWRAEKRGFENKEYVSTYRILFPRVVDDSSYSVDLNIYLLPNKAEDLKKPKRREDNNNWRTY